MDNALKEFYAKLDTSKLQYLEQDFKEKILNNYFFFVYNQNNVDIRKIFNEAWLYIEDDQIKICIDADDGLLIDLQENQNLTRIIADALKKVYRYEGKFSIEGLSF